MAGKYLSFNRSTGKTTEVEFTTSSAGAGDAGKGVGLDVTGKIDNSMMPVGVGADVTQATASESLTAGNWVNLYLDTTLKVRKADASNGREANGFVLSNYSSSDTVSVYRRGTNTQCSSLTIGTAYFLSGSTAGGITATVPSTAGHIAQLIGVADSATSLNFSYNQPIVLA